MASNTLPKLITFDGEARSGKGTIVQATKDYLRDEVGYHVMLIDAGQVFRSLVVATTRADIDLNDPDAVDAYLSDETNLDACTQFVKDVYHMTKEERDAILYTNEVSENSAKIGRRPLAQYFKDSLLKKWLHDAALEGFEVVLLDGRALEETGEMLESGQLCEFVLGLYFVCDPIVGARRTLGCAETSYDNLTDEQKQSVDQLVTQINERNEADRSRAVQPIVPPTGAPTFVLPDVGELHAEGRAMAIIDTSGKMTKEAMSRPIAELAASFLES